MYVLNRYSSVVEHRFLSRQQHSDSALNCLVVPGELANTESTRQNQRDEPARASNESAQALVEDEETLTEDEQNALTAQIGILQDMLRTSIAIDKRNNKDAWADQKQATFDNMELMRKKRWKN